jgi:hypothetical protein
MVSVGILYTALRAMGIVSQGWPDAQLKCDHGLLFALVALSKC